MMRSTLPWNRSGHVVVAALCCICVLLPLVQGLDGQEIDLEFANHDRATVDKVVLDSRHADVATLRKPAAPWVRRDKPNKSSSKKFVEKGWPDSQYGKSKKSIYDKKYFDYLPAELKDSPETSADVFSSKRTNSRRIRRSATADVDREESQRSKRHGWYVQPVASYSYTLPQMVYSVGNWPPVLSQQYPAVYQPSVQFGSSYPTRGPLTTPSSVDRTYLPPSTTKRPSSTPPDRTYLPVPTQSPNNGAPVDGGLGNRFNFDNDPDRFVFDVVYDTNRVNYNLQPRPQQGRFPPTPTTRRPQAPFRPETATVSPRRTTTTPRPSIQHNSDDDYDWSSLGLDSDIGNRLGVGGEDSNNDVNNNKGRKKPSKCTWAIANCCSHNSDRIRYYCFEQNQCYGAFWGENVCRQYFQAALKEIENYYDV